MLPERKLRDWELFDHEEPIGSRESRQQMALLLAKYQNVHRPKGAPPVELEDFLLQTAENAQQRQTGKMLATLAAVARPRPPGYKRKRPKQRNGHDRSSKTGRPPRS